MESVAPSRQPQWHPLPAYHLKAPRGWINDPCAPSYDVATGTYHLFYQWNPRSCDWGHICWGHFTSKDGVRWAHNGDQPVLEPSLPYDEKGIFTGCLHPTGPYGEQGQLTIFYSSIRSLPIHWTIPYTRNCAGIALATSSDGGRTWQKSQLNPILEGEPPGTSVTGFRDPYVAEWPAMDELRGQGPSLYGLVSGGVVDDGPDAFVYAIQLSDLTKWTYIGRLCDIPLGLERPTHWSGDFGVNWECVNFMTLETESRTAKLDFLILGAEGGRVRKGQEDGDERSGVSTLWTAGALSMSQGVPKFKHEINGVLDSSDLYAASSYKHPESGKRVLWGWIKEEDLTLARRERKGWTGYLSLPREMFLYEATRVIRTLRTPLDQIPSLQLVRESSASDSGGTTVRTLGLRPLRSLEQLRSKKPRIWRDLSNRGAQGPFAEMWSTSWEMGATVSIAETCEARFGFHILHGEDMLQRTSISFDPRTETITIDKRLSNNEDDVKKEPVTGPFTLFVYGDGSSGGAASVEKLHLRVFVDGDVVEVFANDRFALASTVYVDSAGCAGLSWFNEAQHGTEHDKSNVVLESVTVWEELSGTIQSPQPHSRL